MDLSKVKDLQRKMDICDRVHLVGLIACAIAYAGGGVFIWAHYVLGVVLLGVSVLLALISGSAQVMESLLYAEERYRITGRRPKKKTKDDPVKSFTRAYAETAGRKSMEDALQLGKELEVTKRTRHEKKTARRSI